MKNHPSNKSSHHPHQRPSLDVFLKRIGPRDWQDVFSYWQDCIPAMSFPIENFETSIEDTSQLLQQVGEEVATDEDSSTNRLHYYELPGVRYKVFREAISLFYKAQNAIKSAQSDIRVGLKTWSIVNFYQASYHSIKSLLNVLGIHLCKTIPGSRDLIVDLLSPRGLKHKQVVECQIHLAWQLEHWQLWGLLQRVIRMTGNLPFDKRLVDVFNFECKTFARQRNLIIYHDAKWIFDDLKMEESNSAYTDPLMPDDLENIADHEAFTIVLESLVSIASFKMF